MKRISRNREMDPSGSPVSNSQSYFEANIQTSTGICPANKFLSNLIQSSVDGIIAADMKGEVIIFNEGAEKLLGYKSEEVVGELSVKKLYPKGVARELMRKMRLEKHGGKGKLVGHQLIGVAKNGERIPVSLSGAIVYDETGEEMASVGFFTDLRERNRMRKQLEEVQMHLVQSERMASLGKLAAGIAHEINNPLSGLLLFAQILQDRFSDDKQADSDLERIVEECIRCKEIVQRLLEFARQSEQGKLPVDINRFLQQSLALLKGQALFHDIEIVEDLEKNLPCVRGNGTQLHQVFLNLLINAADAMANGGTLTIRTCSSPDDDLVRAEVSDSGTGITKENLPNIFDPFFTTKEVGKGTGLGLSVAYGIVNEHNGRIKVESEPGIGTTFSVLLPIDKQKDY